MATRNANGGTEDDLPSAVVEDLLAADSRRRALSILADSEEPMIVEDLARAVVAARRDCPASAVPTADTDAMAEELFTEHIPKLTATRVLHYDSMLGTVELRRRDLTAADRQ